MNGLYLTAGAWLALALGGACVTPAGTPPPSEATPRHAAPPDPPPAQASPVRIGVERLEGAVVLRGIYEAAAPPAAELEYRLEAAKHGAAGISTTRQGGAFTPTPGRADTLSVVRLGVQPGDSLAVRLTVTGPDGAVGEAVLDEVVE